MALPAEDRNLKRAIRGRVLVVDDDHDFAEGLDILLTPEGYELELVQTARSARKALESFDADVALIAARGTDPSLFDNVVGDLESNLPEVFSLKAILPEPEAAPGEGPPRRSRWRPRRRASASPTSR